MFGLSKFGDGIGLHRVARFMDTHGIDRAELARRSIAVTGTNGKGSTARFLTSALGTAGLRVGCFTSPHLFDVRERFTIGSDMISQDALDRHAATVAAFNATLPEGDHIGAFEFLFLTALLWFREERPDAIVWEAGIGGRYDPIRTVRANISVLTSIELEHTELLGSTEELIAYDKVDAAAPGACVVLSPSIPTHLSVRLAAFAGLSDKTLLPALEGRRLGAVLNDAGGAHFTYGPASDAPEADQPVMLRLAGRHQVDNAVTALRAAEVWLDQQATPRSASREAMLGALGETTWPGRLQQVAMKPDLWIDVGHTPCAVDAVTRTFLEFTPRERTLVVFGVSGSKEVAAIARTVAGRFDHFILTRAFKAGAATDQFEDIFRAIASDVTVAADTVEAARLARARAARDGLTILAVGGLFLAAEIQRAWEGGDPREIDFL
ncbi:MAG: hypothetical protein R3C46_06670 [Hyphomonadaceae bacterium]